MDVVLQREYSIDKTWFRYIDPRPIDDRKPSMTVHNRWFYGPDDRLEIAFSADPSRRWNVVLEGVTIGFSPDVSPEPVPGDSIRAAKRLAVELLESLGSR